ncbi:hypothetical protein M1N64_04945 [Peptococcaceae bacterium]|nr:hypothetical protein [Peptococcaceae bacterium]
MFDIDGPLLEWYVISLIAVFIGIYLGVKKGISITNPSWLKEGFWEKYPLLRVPSSKKLQGEIISTGLFIIVAFITTIVVGMINNFFVNLLEYSCGLIAPLLGILISILPTGAVSSILLELQRNLLLYAFIGFPDCFLFIVVIPLTAFTIMFITQVIHIVLLDWIVDKRIVSNKSQEGQNCQHNGSKPNKHENKSIRKI